MVCQSEHICTRILFVADPQIIGNQNEVIHFLTPLSILDCDRYDNFNKFGFTMRHYYLIIIIIIVIYMYVFMYI